MTKDELKNRISLALKDPILQQGFEIICKENATLKEDYECLEDAHNVLNELYEKLEKENAELKEKNKWYSEQVCNKECAEVWGNLTKAKEIIKYLCGVVRELNKPNVQLTDVDYSLSEAEQFLSEVEK